MTTEELVKPAELTGLVSEAEGEALAYYAGRASAAIVEIGSYTGKSTCFLAGEADVPVFAIDLWDLLLPSENKKKRRNKHKYAVKFNSTAARAVFTERTSQYTNVVPVRAESKQIAAVWTRPIGLLFIDGAHDYTSVSADYLGFSYHVIGGGWLAMHDATPGSKVERVIQDAVIPSGLWGERRQVERLAIFQRLEA